MRNLIILSSYEVGGRLQSLYKINAHGSSVLVVTTLEELRHATENVGEDDFLLAHSTSVIVPPETLRKFGHNAVNIHSASPEFPGRDPHHFAIYRRASRYGATLHRMDAAVDAGAILDVELFDVDSRDTPASLLEKANDAAMVLAERLFVALKRDVGVPGPSGLNWGKIKTTRADFLELCRLTPEMELAEVRHRIASTQFLNRTNVWLEMWGMRFELPSSQKK